MAYEQIVYEKLGAVGRVTLNRPEVYNAQSRLLRDEMDQAFDAAVADDDVRVIVLAGAGKHFSVGHDIGVQTQEDARRRNRSEYDILRDSWRYNVENSLRWRDLPKPTIAQVQGYCIYGGWIIAAAMDLIVAAEDALFLPGLVQHFTVPWDLGVRKAKEVLFESRFLTAEEALAAGFVNRVVPPDRLEEATLELAEAIAESDPLLLRLTKQAINDAHDAMGHRASVQSAHSAHLIVRLAGVMKPPEGSHRLHPVDQAVRKLRRARKPES
jgi:enoyl-CoA hydratase